MHLLVNKNGKNRFFRKIKGRKILPYLILIIVASSLGYYLGSLYIKPYVAYKVAVKKGVKDVAVRVAARSKWGFKVSYTLSISAFTVTKYPRIIHIANIGRIGFKYKINVTMRILKPKAVEYLGIFLGDKPVSTYSNGKFTCYSPIILKPKEVKELTLIVEPARNVTFNMLIPVIFQFYDPSKPKVTNITLTLNLRVSDWYEMSFPERIRLMLKCKRNGYAIFEIVGSGEIFLNGEFLCKIPAMAGLTPRNILIVDQTGNIPYIIPFQVEEWHSVGKLPGEVPLSIKKENSTIDVNDRLVFKAYLHKGVNNILIYLYGVREVKFPKTDVKLVEGGIETEYWHYNLTASTIETENWILNCSSNFQAYKIGGVTNETLIYFWDPVLSGPVRTIVRATAIARGRPHSIIIYLMVYSHSQLAEAYIYPGNYRVERIVLWWELFSFKGVNASIKVSKYMLNIFKTTFTLAKFKIRKTGNLTYASFWIIPKGAGGFYITGGTSRIAVYYMPIVAYMYSERYHLLSKHEIKLVGLRAERRR